MRTGRPRLSIAEALSRVLGGDAPIEFSAYDGSRSGPPEASVRVELRSPRALSYLVGSPGGLGLGRAYVAGELDVHGDIYEGLRALATTGIGNLTWQGRLEVLRALDPRALRPVAPPPEEVRRSFLGVGPRHTPMRDGRVISHHYDVSNRFYRWVLGPSMAYTCAVYPRKEATLEEAQEEKFDLVCRKLGLERGQRLLDVGCGWGGMVMHAAEHYGVKALGVTLSREQAAYAQEEIRRRGLQGLAEVRHSDYRAVHEDGFDAVSSIGLTEHIGKAQLGAYARHLHARLRPGGRLLNHCIMRPTTKGPSVVKRGFINRYVFPDGELEGLGTVVGALQDHGLEVRHEEGLREHYALTLRDWGRNLDEHWDDAVAEIGEGKARVWRVYMAGSRLGFERGSIELHQVLCVKADRGDARFALRPDFERPRP
ncbi:SAM-dependent methyltransferase [Vallicoccus soli]|uniref:SAM-dependent methyltransferase n=1 Tax=Vallicoccus soli TaxID=2339232 RepID=UPI001C4990AF|nr:cyclopropane-fatty-acyl-phospholipid synthase family protein [Vallicoccus soli]